MSREELKEIARKILDYRRKNDYSQIFSSLSEEDKRALIPLIKEVGDEQIAKERAEHEAFMKKEREFDRETREFIAETDKFIADTERRLSRRENSPSIYFPFAMGEA